MKRIIIALASIGGLSGCVDQVETPKAVIDYPTLSLHDDFSLLEKNSEEVPLSVTSSQQIISDVLFRFMNIVDFANQSTSLVAEADMNADLKFKPGSRDLYIRDASDEYCGGENGSEASIWDDRDNSSNASEGDIWYYRIVNCQSKINSSFTTGLISQTGMYELFLQQDIDPEKEQVNIEFPDDFEDYLYTLDIQIDPQNGKVAYFKNAAISYSKFQNDVATASIGLNTLMGVSKTTSIDDQMYLFKVENAFIKNDDENEILEVSLTARYYDTEIGGYVNISTPDKLVFDYSYKLAGEIREDKNPYDLILLTSGELLVTTENDSANLVVNTTDETKVTFSFNDDSSTSRSFEQSIYFNTYLDGLETDKTFSLVNMSR